MSKIVSNGNRVVFDSTGSYIESKKDGSRLWLRERGGVYVLDVWVAPSKDKASDDGNGGAGKQDKGFRRQDQ